MKCRRAQTLMHSFIDGMIDDQERSQLERHLSDCPSCEREARQLAKSLDLIHRLEPIQVSDNFNWKVKLAIARERNEMVSRSVADRSWWRRWNQRFAISAVATFALMVVAGFVCYSSLYQSLTAFLPTMLATEYDVSVARSAHLGALVVIANVAGNVGAGWLIGRGAIPWKLLTLSFVAMGV